jgi:hypothetical protein
MSKLTVVKQNRQARVRKKNGSQPDQSVLWAVSDLRAAYAVALRRAGKLQPATRAMLNVGKHDDWVIHESIDRFDLAEEIEAVTAIVAAAFGVNPSTVEPSANGDEFTLLAICDHLSSACENLKGAKAPHSTIAAAGKVIRQIEYRAEELISAA